MKKVSTMLLLMSITMLLLTVQAQFKKPEAVTLGNSKQLTGVVLPLTENQTYNFIVPEKLNYWAKGSTPGGTFNSLPLTIRAMKAKKDTKNPPDYVFTLITPGMQSLEQGDPILRNNNTKAVPFKYTFPCKLQVSDKAGNVLTTYTLSADDDWTGCMVLPNFLADVELRPNYMPVAGFTQSDAEVAKWVTQRQKEIHIRMEYNAYVNLVKLANRVISNSYGFPEMQSKPVILSVNKKDKANYPELNQAVEKFSTEVTKAFAGPVDDALQKELIASGDFFESQYTRETTKELTQLCALNSGLAYLLGGDTEKAYVNFANADKVLGALSSAGMSFGFFVDVAMMNQLRAEKDKSDIYITQTLSVTERKNMEEKAAALAKEQAGQDQKDMDMAALKARNIEERNGYIVTKDGQKIEGAISLKLVETAGSNTLDLDLGKIVKINFGTTYKYFRPKEVSYIMVDEDRYEPVAMDMGAGWQVFSVATSGSNAGAAYFMKLVHRTGNCAAFVDQMIVSSTSYAIMKQPHTKAVSFSELLKNGKSAKTFVGESCPGLQEKLDSKTIINNEEGIKQFTDLLSNCL